MDFGRELYVAWRVSEGDVLHRDVASFYGPLSPYFNGALFRVFGASLRTLVFANLALLAAACAALWWAVRRCSSGGSLGATAGVLLFLASCGFAQLVSAGSFNFVCPYSHEATHGFVLATLAVVAGLRLVAGGGARWAAAAGAGAGLAFLTKPEAFLAAACGAGAALVLGLRQPGSRPPATRVAGMFAAGLLAPPAVALLLLSLALPLPEAWTGVLGSWAFSLNEDLWASPYFAWSMGTQDVAGSLGALARASAAQLGLFGAVLALSLLGRRYPRATLPLAALAAAGSGLGLAATWQSPAWREIGRPLPLWDLAALAWCATNLWRSRHDGASFPRQAARLVLALFALSLLPRMALNARFYHYGFLLAGPSLLLVAALLLDWIPAALARRGAPAAVWRSAALVLLAGVAAHHLGATRGRLQAKTVTLGQGGDRMLTDARGRYVQAALDGLRQASRHGDTLVVLPEGALLNYLLRLPSSVPYLSMLPSDVAQYGEDELLGALRRGPPSLIVLVHRDSSEFGARFFGRDYGELMARWIAERYEPIGRVGDPPLQDGSTFGLAVLRRRSEAPAREDADRRR